jgi:hypothetical protein
VSRASPWPGGNGDGVGTGIGGGKRAEVLEILASPSGNFKKIHIFLGYMARVLISYYSDRQ